MGKRCAHRQGVKKGRQFGRKGRRPFHDFDKWKRPLALEQFEPRAMLASPQLIAIVPNVGDVLLPGQIRNEAPRELTFRFDSGQVIDPTTLAGIEIRRAGGDNTLGTLDDVMIVGGFVGIGERPNEVVFRFAEALPDDRYRITVFGSGPTPLENMAGEVFNNGVNQQLNFELDLGAQIVAVVPQPISRGAGGSLSQATNQIVVYFNDDNLSSSATNPAFYQLIYTAGTLSAADDVVHLPTSVSYNSTTDTATLNFATPLHLLSSGTGLYRLRIGNDAAPRPVPLLQSFFADPESTFVGAAALNDLGTLGAQSRILAAAIEAQPFLLPLPGGIDEPGHRDIPAEAHLGGADVSGGVPTIYYNFKDVYGTVNGNNVHNLITENQKQRAREIFEIYSYYLGVQFIESPDQGLIIATGDLRAVAPDIPTGPGGVAGIAGGGVAVMDNAENWGNGEYGGSWFNVAMHEIGHLLGLGHTYDLPPGTVMGNNGTSFGNNVEPVFPGDHDIVHAQHLYRPDVKDIDLFRFELPSSGRLTAEIFAERLNTSSRLDGVLTLYDGQRNLIARNDNYFSKDAFLDLELASGTYFIAVTSTGNTDFDPNIEDSGFGGTSQGAYELRLEFEASAANHLRDTTGVILDGDADGVAGGEFNFWFRVATPSDTLIVDKLAPLGGNGSLAAPYKTIAAAFAAAGEGDVVRIVGNQGPDGNPATKGDEQVYQIGVDSSGTPLVDGLEFRVPKNVTVMIDEGAIFKLRRANLDVGTSELGVDRSGGALQVLGTPRNQVIFTSWHDESVGIDPLPGTATTPVPGDWGGFVFRNDSDFESRGIFLNHVGQALIRHGGGTVVVDGTERQIHAIQLVTSRPTIAFSTISSSADEAISADPNSFEETRFVFDESGIVAHGFALDYDRVGPNIYGNRLVGNTINGLFVRIRTDAGRALDVLEVAARFDDKDIVHVISENLVIQGTPGGQIRTGGVDRARLDARLTIDPSIVVKMNGSRIEMLVGGQLIAEGQPLNRVIFTSIFDDRYGAGGTFDTNQDNVNGVGTPPSPGDWGGIYVGPTSSASLDHVLLTFAGGVTTIEGNFDAFNAIEIYQSDVRITNSVFERNGGGLAQSNRNGRQQNAPGTIFVRGAQPIIVNNIIRDGFGPAININANAMNWLQVADYGRSRGLAAAFTQFVDNHGPLVQLNRLGNNAINGMVVRGATLTTESIWDDTGIVHVLLDQITIGNHHTYSGLRLQSSPTESLVVKLFGANAGITATGTPLDIDDRIGGTLQVIGFPNHSVVLTSLRDDSVGAGVDPNGQPQTNTDNVGALPSPGDWRSLKLAEYSNDRNVEIITETEDPLRVGGETNNITSRAHSLGVLAPNEKSGDDVRRLGFEVHGYLGPGDVDLYRFTGTGGTEVWIDIDRTTHALDTVIELLNANGTMLARSDDSPAEEAGAPLTGTALLMRRSTFDYGDLYTTNPRDAGMRVVLPGAVGSTNTYYIRVRAKSPDLSVVDGGVSRGVYQWQLRLREAQEVPGSTIRHSDIRYATNGIELVGLPANSPLLGESVDIELMPANQGLNDLMTQAQALGNLLTSNLNALAVGGVLATPLDVDWYVFTIDYSSIQEIAGVNDQQKTWATVFDIDYADGMSRPDTTISVFDELGRLIYIARDSDVADDQPEPGQGSSADDLSRGTFGKKDPYLGSVSLKEGTYFVAVHSAHQIPTQLSSLFDGNPEHQLTRIANISTIQRVVEDHIGPVVPEPDPPLPVPKTSAILPVANAVELRAHVTPFTLSDVALFVSQGNDSSPLRPRLNIVNPFTGALVRDIGPLGDIPDDVRDIVMRSDGQLFGYQSQLRTSNFENSVGQLVHIDPSTGDLYVMGRDNIPDQGTGEDPDDFNTLTSASPEALTYRWWFDDNTVTTDGERYRLLYAVGDFTSNIPGGVSRLFAADSRTGDATPKDNRPDGAIGIIQNTTAFNVTMDILPDVPGLTVVDEDAGTITARITRTGDLLLPLIVSLQSSNTGIADFELPQVEIPAGEASVDVNIIVVNNPTVTGTRSVEFSLFSFDALYEDSSVVMDVDDAGTDPASAFFVSLPGSVQESTGGTITARVFVSQPQATDTFVIIRSSDETELIVPSPIVLIPANATFADFNVQVVDDGISDSTQNVQLTASALTFQALPNLTIDINPVAPGLTVVSENVGLVAARIIRTGSVNSAVTVAVVSDDPSLAEFLPVTVTIPAGSATQDIVITVKNNAVPNPAKSVRLAVSSLIAGLYEGSSAVLDINDDDPPTAAVGTLNVTLATSVREDALTLDGTVTRNGDTTNPLTVRLFSSDLTELTVPVDVTIPAGATSAQFTVTVLNDGVADPSQLVQISASADGFRTGQATVSVDAASGFRSGQANVFVLSTKTPIGFTTGMAFVKFEGRTLGATSGDEIIDGQIFSVSDANQTVVFEFDSNGILNDPTRTRVFFQPFMFASDVANEMEFAITNSSLNVEITNTGVFNFSTLVTVVGAFGAASLTSPVLVFDLANHGYQLWGVSDTGNIYTIDEYSGQAEIELNLGSQVRFAGLALGPQNLDIDGDGFGGDLATTLFAITRNGDLYAFDTLTSQLRTDVFENGATSINVGLNSVTGLAFSTLDFNLWHPTTQGATDPGHTAPGSFYFGMEERGGGYVSYAQGTQYGILQQDSQYGVLLSRWQHRMTDFTSNRWAPEYFEDMHATLRDPEFANNTLIGNNYNLPGGAHGSLVTDSFSLAGYSSTDLPQLYFTYFLEHGGETVRVSGSIDGGETWTTLTQNGAKDGTRPGRLFNTERDPATQLLSNVWREALVDIRQFAGQADIRLRFEFVSNGSDNNYKGFYIDDIIVGFVERGEEVLSLTNDTTFFTLPTVAPPVGPLTYFSGGNSNLKVGPYQLEIRRGHEAPLLDTNDRLAEGFRVEIPNGFALPDGKTVTIYDGLRTVTFEFNQSGGVVPGHIAVPYLGTNTAEQVALSLANTINAARASGQLLVSASPRPPEHAPNSFRVELWGAKTVTEGQEASVVPGPLSSLADYVAFVDPSYQYAPVAAHDPVGQAYSWYVLDMTSQTWRTTADVSPVDWHHWVTVIVPDLVTSDTALLVISGGSWMNPIPTSVDTDFARLAVESQSIVVLLPTVPNQPLSFVGDDRPSRSEDAAIAYTFDQFLDDTNDDEWPLLLPMVKSAVRAMDSAQSFLANDLTTSIDVGHFVVTGASKRGWTTWLTAAIDDRVVGFMPVVFDALNLDESMTHHRSVYQNVQEFTIDGYSLAIIDYVEAGVLDPDRLRTPEGQLLLRIVDPYEYVLDQGVYGQRLSKPKYLINGTGDEFFVLDSSQFYYDQLRGPTYLRYLPNAGHALSGTNAADVAGTFYQALLNNEHLPEFTWEINDDGSITVTTIDTPMEVRLWSSTNPRNRDFRYGGGLGVSWSSELVTLQPGVPQTFLLATPPTGARAFMIELTYDSGRTAPFVFTTGVSVLSPFDDGISEFRIEQFDRTGDTNRFRPQGQTLIDANRIADSLQYGIKIGPDERDLFTNAARPSSPLTLRELNQQALVPGITIQNNLIVRGGQGGIQLSGDASTAPPQSAPVPIAAVPFARIVNNTLFGNLAPTGIGIEVRDRAGPTLMNNIVSGFTTGISVDSTSFATTVIGGTIYKSNATNTQGFGLGEFAITLNAADPLFVGPASDNFYLAAGSRAIDSSINSLQDRPGIANVKGAVGISLSPILAPDRDLFGQRRGDDTTVASPPGLGSDVFKDRGALDRIDITGPTASLVGPEDNDSLGLDIDPTLTRVRYAGRTVSEFVIRFRDGLNPSDPEGGTGADPSTVTASRFRVFVDDVELVEGLHYHFSYDASNRVARFVSSAGVWLNDHTYRIELNNTVNGIKDLAGNQLKSNQIDNSTTFTIKLESQPVSPWQNPVNPLDVDNDGFVTSSDALALWNTLNPGTGPPQPRGPRLLPNPPVPPDPILYYDVDGDGWVTSSDALAIYNYLNSQAKMKLVSLSMVLTTLDGDSPSDSATVDSFAVVEVAAASSALPQSVEAKTTAAVEPLGAAEVAAQQDTTAAARLESAFQALEESLADSIRSVAIEQASLASTGLPSFAATAKVAPITVDRTSAGASDDRAVSGAYDRQDSTAHEVVFARTASTLSAADDLDAILFDLALDQQSASKAKSLAPRARLSRAR